MSRWLALESNPDVWNKFLSNLGVSDEWKITDVYGLDEGMLGMVPQPVAALVLLFPLTEKAEDFRKTQCEGIKAAGQEVSSNVFFFKQYVGNACGTVALVHSVANSLNQVPLKDGEFKKFIDDNKSKSPEDIGKEFEESSFIEKIHDDLAKEGQTAPPDIDEAVNEHFISLVNVDGNLYEMDGRKDFPINHGPTSSETFLLDSASVCRDFMSRDPKETKFAILALAKAE